MLFVGCQSLSKSDSTSNRTAPQGADSTAAAKRPGSDNKTSGGSSRSGSGGGSGGGQAVAYVNGQPLYESTIRQRLYEAAGGDILTEEILESLLRDRLQARGVTVTNAMIEQERQILNRTKISQPVPVEGGFATDDQIVSSERPQSVDEPVGSFGIEVPVQPLVAIVIDHAHVHGVGVQIDAAVELVTLIVKSHRVFS